jgi:Cu/Ag efflux pump CusA
VAVWTPERLRTDLPSLGRLWIDTPAGKAPLRDLVDLRIAPTPNVIRHESACRQIDVS